MYLVKRHLGTKVTHVSRHPHNSERDQGREAWVGIPDHLSIMLDAAVWWDGRGWGDEYGKLVKRSGCGL